MPGGDHPSATAVAGSLMQPTRELGRAALNRSRSRRQAPTSWPCSRWGLPSRPGHPGRWWSLTPPFHPYRPKAAVYSLWHCPADRSGWALAITLPWGVRTFLDTSARQKHRGRPTDSSETRIRNLQWQPLPLGPRQPQPIRDPPLVSWRLESGCSHTRHTRPPRRQPLLPPRQPQLAGCSTDNPDSDR